MEDLEIQFLKYRANSGDEGAKIRLEAYNQEKQQAEAQKQQANPPEVTAEPLPVVVDEAVSPEVRTNNSIIYGIEGADLIQREKKNQ